MINIAEIMNSLSSQRQIYHSEADFQHAFAWEVHKRLSLNSPPYLERPLKVNGQTLHLDLFIQLPGIPIAVELKYKTRKINVDIGNETFDLADHSAQDTGRYDFIKDIHRLEKITSAKGISHGYAIFLTNDSAYWKSGRLGTVDEAFRLNEGRVLNGTLSWSENASAGTKKNRERELKITGNYELSWQNFSEVSAPRYGQFKYLAVGVTG
jgi:hypothetical protein